MHISGRRNFNKLFSKSEKKFRNVSEKLLGSCKCTEILQGSINYHFYMKGVMSSGRKCVKITDVFIGDIYGRCWYFRNESKKIQGSCKCTGILQGSINYHFYMKVLMSSGRKCVKRTDDFIGDFFGKC